MRYILLIILAMNVIGCSSSSNEDDCTWQQMNEYNGHWNDVCSPRDKRI